MASRYRCGHWGGPGLLSQESNIPQLVLATIPKDRDEFASRTRCQQQTTAQDSFGVRHYWRYLKTRQEMFQLFPCFDTEALELFVRKFSHIHDENEEMDFRKELALIDIEYLQFLREMLQIEHNGEPKFVPVTSKPMEARHRIVVNEIFKTISRDSQFKEAKLKIQLVENNHFKETLLRNMAHSQEKILGFKQDIYLMYYVTTRESALCHFKSEETNVPYLASSPDACGYFDPEQHVFVACKVVIGTANFAPAGSDPQKPIKCEKLWPGNDNKVSTLFVLTHSDPASHQTASRLAIQYDDSVAKKYCMPVAIIEVHPSVGRNNQNLTWTTVDPPRISNKTDGASCDSSLLTFAKIDLTQMERALEKWTGGGYTDFREGGKRLDKTLRRMEEKLKEYESKGGNCPRCEYVHRDLFVTEIGLCLKELTERLYCDTKKGCQKGGEAVKHEADKEKNGNDDHKGKEVEEVLVKKQKEMMTSDINQKDNDNDDDEKKEEEVQEPQDNSSDDDDDFCKVDKKDCTEQEEEIVDKDEVEDEDFDKIDQDEVNEIVKEMQKTKLEDKKDNDDDDDWFLI